MSINAKEKELTRFSPLFFSFSIQTSVEAAEAVRALDGKWRVYFHEEIMFVCSHSLNRSPIRVVGSTTSRLSSSRFSSCTKLLSSTSVSSTTTSFQIIQTYLALASSCTIIQRFSLRSLHALHPSRCTFSFAGGFTASTSSLILFLLLHRTWIPWSGNEIYLLTSLPSVPSNSGSLDLNFEIDPKLRPGSASKRPSPKSRSLRRLGIVLQTISIGRGGIGTNLSSGAHGPLES